jgi:hypothetical protein
MLKDNLDATNLRMEMERVWTDIAKPYPNLNLSVSPCPAHKSMHGCRFKSKSTRYPDIHEFTHYVHHHNNIQAFLHFCNILAIIIWTMEKREGGSGGHGRGCFDCLVCLARYE